MESIESPRWEDFEIEYCNVSHTTPWGRHTTHVFHSLVQSIHLSRQRGVAEGSKGGRSGVLSGVEIEGPEVLLNRPVVSTYLYCSSAHSLASVVMPDLTTMLSVSGWCAGLKLVPAFHLENSRILYKLVPAEGILTHENTARVKYTEAGRLHLTLRSQSISDALLLPCSLTDHIYRGLHRLPGVWNRVSRNDSAL
jgi:hypothetical protein